MLKHSLFVGKFKVHACRYGVAIRRSPNVSMSRSQSSHSLRSSASKCAERDNKWPDGNSRVMVRNKPKSWSEATIYTRLDKAADRKFDPSTSRDRYPICPASTFW